MPIHVPASPPYDAIGESSAVRVVDHPQTILDDYPSYLRDESRLTGNAERLVFASSEHHIVSLLKEASNDRTQVTISAGRTGVVGGGVPQGGILLSMERMDRFRGVRWDEDQNRWILNGEPGITIRDLQDQLDRSAFQDFVPHAQVYHADYLGGKIVHLIRKRAAVGTLQALVARGGLRVSLLLDFLEQRIIEAVFRYLFRLHSTAPYLNAAGH